ncbi:MAG: 50S ribosomal protein L29 [Candidatus Woesearchaeota archaeon]
MKAKQIRELNKTDLMKKLSELEMEMVKYNTQISSGATIKSPALVRNTKRDIARLKQEIKNKENNG